jgi:hypothetical protein
MWPHSDQVRQWQLRHHTTKAQIAADRKEKKEASRQLWQEALNPVRAEYRRASPARRRQIIAYILEYITRR